MLVEPRSLRFTSADRVCNTARRRCGIATEPCGLVGVGQSPSDQQRSESHRTSSASVLLQSSAVYGTAALVVFRFTRNKECLVRLFLFQTFAVSVG